MKPFGLMLAVCESLSERQALPQYSPTAIISGARTADHLNVSDKQNRPLPEYSAIRILWFFLFIALQMMMPSSGG